MVRTTLGCRLRAILLECDITCLGTEDCGVSRLVELVRCDRKAHKYLAVEVAIMLSMGISIHKGSFKSPAALLVLLRTIPLLRLPI
jgi:hypothetical protein